MGRPAERSCFSPPSWDSRFGSGCTRASASSSMARWRHRGAHGGQGRRQRAAGRGARVLDRQRPSRRLGAHLRRPRLVRAQWDSRRSSVLQARSRVQIPPPLLRKAVGARAFLVRGQNATGLGSQGERARRRTPGRRKTASWIFFWHGRADRGSSAIRPS
jgi:hypothetical protein